LALDTELANFGCSGFEEAAAAQVWHPDNRQAQWLPQNRPEWLTLKLALTLSWPASTAFWPHTDSLFGTWYEALLATASVGTTVFFVVGSTSALLRGSHSLRRTFAWAAAMAFLVHSHWYVRLRHDGWVSDLGIGYFLWWWSFIMLAIGLFDLAGRNDAAEFTHSQAAPLPR
jgi:hypothetical protein